MTDSSTLLLLLLFGSAIVAWLKLSVARERAVHEARRQCEQHGLQLLDETVGLRSIRLRRIDGWRRLERCYTFEVSIDGDDREPGRLWMIDQVMSGLSLPTIELMQPRDDLQLPRLQTQSTTSNVTVLRPGSRDDHRLH
jgi:hypothetical protein